MGFKLTHGLPEKCLVAVSGGVDSVSVLSWLSVTEGRVAGLVHMHHNTGEFADQALALVERKAEELQLPLHVRRLDRSPETGHSPENWWRDQRYRWLKEVSATHENLPVVLGHNFDDCVEEYIMCTMVRGFQGTIPYAHGPCIRPFRLWKRRDILRYAKSRDLEWVEDPSNNWYDVLKRARIRHKIIPEALKLNPGLYNIVERVMAAQDRRDKCEETSGHSFHLHYAQF